jgi:FkbM family methyltransferase
MALNRDYKMKKLISYLFSIFGLRITRFVKNKNIITHINERDEIQRKRVIPWFEINGDRTLRLNYDLNPNSIVMDLGGYEGEWSADIYCKYSSKILIFEPNYAFYKNIQNGFEKNLNVQVFNFGLAESDRVEKLSLRDNSSSIFIESDNYVEIHLKSAKQFVHDQNLTNVDLIKINIEGGEYEFLESLIQNDLVRIFDNIQVQFHDFVPNAVERMNKIQMELSKSHYLTYNYEFVWENWKRK